MWYRLMLVGVALVDVIAGIDGLSNPSDGVCSSSVSFSQSYQESYSSSFSQRYYSSCGLFGWDRCTRHRSVYRRSYRTNYRVEYRTSYSCCTGWQDNSARGSSCLPICAPSCSNGGTCIRPNTCSCPSRYTGNRCQIPICTQSCLNGGTCTRPNTCSCSSRYTGNRCQTPICTPSCWNGGTCTRPNTCSCRSGYTGTRCQTPICTPSCSNGGICTRPNTCSCPSRYTGNRCQTPICSPSCSNGGTCTRPNTCSCPSRYSGNRCQTPICTPSCSNGGTCNRRNTCSCPSGYTGNRCQKPICTPSCSNGGTCTKPNTCSCPSGYTDNRCQTPICTPSCSNGGTCTRPNTCLCPSGYAGNRCQTPICTPLCSNGGTCTRPNTCSCPSKYTGNRCQTAICTPLCSNGGTCTRPNTCSCPSGYTGNRCQTPICTPSCSNGGTCTRPNTCSCPSKYTGNRCQTPICTPSCSNGGTCIRPNTCSCPSGYAGNRCQAPICTSLCSNGGTCTTPNTCSCPSGYTGNRCQTLSNVCPDDIEVFNDHGKAGAIVNWREIIMEYTNVTSSHKPRDLFPLGLTIVTYTFTNNTVNSLCSFQIYVKDTEPPTIDCPEDSTHIFTTGNGLSVKWSRPSVDDNSGENILPTSNIVSGSMFALGTTSVHYTVVDSSGNRQICDFQISVKAQSPADEQDTVVGILTWQQTDVGLMAESEQRCPVDSERRNYGIANRTCSLDDDLGPVWSEPQILRECGRKEEIDEWDVAQIPITKENVVEVAAALVNITSHVDAVSYVMDLDSVGKAVTNIVGAESASPEVTEAVVQVVDNVLEARNTPIQSMAGNFTSTIVKSLERQIEITLENEGHFQSVQPNIAVEAMKSNHTGVFSGLGFATFINNTDDIFTTNNIRRFTTDKRPATEDVSSSIELPPDVFSNMENKSDITVSFVVYRDNTLFPSPRLSGQSDLIISGSIISAVVGGAISRFKQPVVYRIQPSKEQVNLLHHTSTCVYWDFNLNGGNGDWSEDGCVMVIANSGRVTCHCTHLTNFAVLMDISGQTGNSADKFDFALDVISKIGCAVSIAALCTTLFIFLIVRRLRRTLPRKLLLNFCVSLMSLYLVFLVGIDAAHTGNEIGCQIVGALLHYFVLTTVFWMGIEARNMYIMLVNVFDGADERHFLLKAFCFAWDIPLIIVTVTVGLRRGHYNVYEYCFLSPGNVFYYGLILPVAIVILHNMVTFVLVMCRLCKARLGGSVTDKTKLQQISQRMQNAFAISVLMGLCWVFGFLAIDEAKRVFQFLFCICNSLQGFMVFILFFVRQEDVRKTVMTSLSTGRSSTDSKGSTLSTKKKFAPTELQLAPLNSTYDEVTVPSTFMINNADTTTGHHGQHTYQGYGRGGGMSEYQDLKRPTAADNHYDSCDRDGTMTLKEGTVKPFDTNVYDVIPDSVIQSPDMPDKHIYEDCATSISNGNDNDNTVYINN